MDKIQELRDYIDELHSKLDYEDYANLINLIDEIDTQVDCKEDYQRDREKYKEAEEWFYKYKKGE